MIVENKIMIYKFSADPNSMAVVLSIGGLDGLLSNIAAKTAPTRTTKDAMTIPAIAPPDKPLDFFL